MPHYEARMSSKGEITVPAEVRGFFDLKLKDGDLIDF
jgi:bifunctional DNA-binding transcriptional regulator/antitoxin component of YhaV-PrlF toxin-antitoxin module